MHSMCHVATCSMCHLHVVPPFSPKPCAVHVVGGDKTAVCCVSLSRIILETEPQMIASRATMRGAEGEAGPVSGAGQVEQVCGGGGQAEQVCGGVERGAHGDQWAGPSARVGGLPRDDLASSALAWAHSSFMLIHFMAAGPR